MKEITDALLRKADRSIAVAKKLLPGEADFAAARAYYAMFYIAEALLAERDLRFSKHAGVHSALGEHFVKTGLMEPKYHRWLVTAFAKRIAADYGVEAEITPDDAMRSFSRHMIFLPPLAISSFPIDDQRSQRSTPKRCVAPSELYALNSLPC